MAPNGSAAQARPIMVWTAAGCASGAELLFALGKHACGFELGFLGCSGLVDSLDRFDRGERAQHIGFSAGVLRATGGVFGLAFWPGADVCARVLPHGVFPEDARLDADARPRVRFQHGMERLRCSRVLMLGFDHARVRIDPGPDDPLNPGCATLVPTSDGAQRFPRSCSSKFPRSRGNASAGLCRW